MKDTTIKEDYIEEPIEDIEEPIEVAEEETVEEVKPVYKYKYKTDEDDVVNDVDLLYGGKGGDVNE